MLPRIALSLSLTYDRGLPRARQGCSVETLWWDDFSSNRYPAIVCRLSMIFSENRQPLFGVML
jgi:hypothetical protein